MRTASGVMQSAATVQREAIQCKEKRGRGEQTMPLETVECVYQPNIECVHRTTMLFHLSVPDTEGQ